jgi:hypothetical protein
MSGLTILIAVSLLLLLWIAYEGWRAPLMRENEDGSFTTIKPTKKLSDLFKKKK